MKLLRIVNPLTTVNYYKGETLCSVITVNEETNEVSVVNHVESFLDKAFGVNETPTYEDYEEFLESRCFPRTRDKMKLVLKDLGLDYYDPYDIVKKTKGRMAEDNFWLEILE